MNGVHMLKKTSIILLGVVASWISTAGTMGPVCTPGNVTVPCKAQLWDLGVQGLYLRSLFDANKAYQLAPINQFKEVENDWDWGYRLEGSYHFNTGNDISINWTHYSSEVTQPGLQATNLVGVAALAVPQFTLVENNKLDQVNLEMGQYIDLGSRYAMRFFSGVQYAAIAVNDTSYNPPPINIINQYNNTDFKGFGPIIGTDYTYFFSPSFSFVMNASGSILYGSSRYNDATVVTPPGLVLFSEYASKKAIVPSLEGKIGLNYAYNSAPGVWNIEGGYKAMNYFSVLQGQLFNSPFTAIRSSDYSLYGPYIGIKYIGLA
jgi:hypothetical protein